MSGKLIIIRGNSGSGKSTIASELRRKMGYGTMLIPQDTIRRDIMRVVDDQNNPSIELIANIAKYGNSIEYDVIIEGILDKKKYGKMLDDIAQDFNEVHSFYFDLSFDETLARHATKDKSDEFGEKEMREWWIEKDYLNWPNETLLTADLSEETVISIMMNRFHKP